MAHFSQNLGNKRSHNSSLETFHSTTIPHRNSSALPWMNNSFDTHIQNVTKKAGSSLKIIREVKGIGKVSTCKLLRLYTTVVRPIMEYGSVIWQGSKQVNKLSTIQQKALCLCLGLPGTAGTETVEVAAGIPPLDLYFRQASIREIAKIQA